MTHVHCHVRVGRRRSVKAEAPVKVPEQRVLKRRGVIGLVSVVVPTFNDQRHLRRCLDSLAEQTYQQIEVIVCDDGSDKPVNTLRAVTDRDRPFQASFVSHPFNLGAPAARNSGARQAVGEFLLFLDSDTTCRPEAIDRMVRTARANPTAAFIYCDFMWGKRRVRFAPFDQTHATSFNICNSSALLRSSWFPGWDEKIQRYQDQDLFVAVMARGGTGVYIPAVLMDSAPVRAFGVSDDQRYNVEQAVGVLAEKYGSRDGRLGRMIRQAKQPSGMNTAYVSTPTPKVAAVTCHWNVCGYDRPVLNYKRFNEFMAYSAAPLYTVELALPGQQHRLDGHGRFVQLRGRSAMFHKERLVQLGAMRAIEDGYDAVAWVDADMAFDSPYWLKFTADALADHRVVQAFHGLTYDRTTDPEAEDWSRRAQFMGAVSAWRRGGESYLTGAVWAAYADFFTKVGMWQYDVLGSGDTAMFFGLTGQVEKVQTHRPITWEHTSEAYHRAVFDWAEKAADYARDSIGSVCQTTHMMTHGSKADRQYLERWRRVDEYDQTWLTANEDGVWEWSSTVDDSTRKRILEYLVNRNEDGPGCQADIGRLAKTFDITG